MMRKTNSLKFGGTVREEKGDEMGIRSNCKQRYPVQVEGYAVYCQVHLRGRLFRKRLVRTTEKRLNGQVSLVERGGGGVPLGR